MVKRKDGFSGERALVVPHSIIEEMEKHPLMAPLHITDIGYYPKAEYHYRERREPITQYILIYNVEGRGWYQLDGQKYEVKSNQYFILPAGKPHAYGSYENEGWTIYWIHFKGSLAEHYAQGASKPIDILPTIDSRINTRMDLFEEIYHTLEMGYSRENLLYACSCFAHYLGTLRYLQSYRNASYNDSISSDPIMITVHYMKENIGKKVTLQELADNLGYSASHFSAIFTQRMGNSPLNYFNQLKIQKACQLLDFTDMKINQVCFKVGIEDNFYFSRLFRKIMGMSPQAYKQMKKG